MTDRELLDELQRAVIETPDEGLTWASGLWTLAEILGYANQRQQRYLHETLVVAGWAQQSITPNDSVQSLPGGWLQTLHVLAEIAGRTSPLLPLSRPVTDLITPAWATSSGRPLGYIDHAVGTQTIELSPPPLTGGLLHLFGSWLADTLDRSGINLAVPDELAPYIFYGVLADMFGKQGRAFDQTRRDYCESRFAEGIAIGLAMVEAVTMP